MKYLACFFVIILGISIFSIFFSSNSINSNWENELQKQILSSEKWIVDFSAQSDIANEEKELLVEKENELIKVWKYQLDNGISTETNVLSFVYDMQVFNPVIILFIIIVSAKMLGIEYRVRTLEPLLLRPVSRIKIISTKLLALIISVITLQCLFNIIIFIVGISFFKWDIQASVIVLYLNGKIIEKALISAIFSATGIILIENIAYAVLVFMLSTFIANQSITLIIGFSAAFLKGIYLEFIERFWTYGKFMLFYNLEYLDQQILLQNNWSKEMGISILVILGYIFLFICISYVAFYYGSKTLILKNRKGT